jgi:hypothetical protein
VEQIHLEEDLPGQRETPDLGRPFPRTQDFGQSSTGDAPVQVHLEEPLGGDHIPEGLEQVPRLPGLNGGDAAGIAEEADGGPLARQGKRARGNRWTWRRKEAAPAAERPQENPQAQGKGKGEKH